MVPVSQPGNEPENAYQEFAAGAAMSSDYARASLAKLAINHDPEVVIQKFTNARQTLAALHSDEPVWAQVFQAGFVALLGEFARFDRVLECSSCGQPIAMVGDHWYHVGANPKHPALPAEPKGGTA